MDGSRPRDGLCTLRRADFSLGLYRPKCPCSPSSTSRRRPPSLGDPTKACPSAPVTPRHARHLVRDHASPDSPLLPSRSKLRSQTLSRAPWHLSALTCQPLRVTDMIHEAGKGRGRNRKGHRRRRIREAPAGRGRKPCAVKNATFSRRGRCS